MCIRDRRVPRALQWSLQGASGDRGAPSPLAAAVAAAAAADGGDGGAAAGHAVAASLEGLREGGGDGPLEWADGGSCGETYLRIASPPTVSMFESKIAKRVGQPLDVTLPDDARGAPEPHFQWYLNETAIAGATGRAHHVAALRDDDFGTYTCEIRNIAGVVLWRGATVVPSGREGGGRAAPRAGRPAAAGAGAPPPP